MRTLAVGVLASLVAAQGAIAQERLQIALVPVYIVPEGAFSQQTYYEPDVHMFTPPADAVYEAMQAIHEAMSMLGIDNSQYDVTRAYGDENRSRVLECSMATPTSPSRCGMVHGDSNQIYPISPERMNNLWVPLGFEPNNPDELQKGSILALILLKSSRFPWAGGGGGSSTFLVWTDIDPQVMHWTTSACAFWAHMYLPAIAHELGHCFGLFHNGAGDINFDGVDSTLDMMVSPQTPAHSARLRPSNQARVDHHFRELDEPISVSRQPMIRSSH